MERPPVSLGKDKIQDLVNAFVGVADGMAVAGAPHADVLTALLNATAAYGVWVVTAGYRGEFDPNYAESLSHTFFVAMAANVNAMAKSKSNQGEGQ